jgi:hypothetical protein
MMAADWFWFLRGTTERSGDVVTFHWDRLVDGGPHRAMYDQVIAAHPGAVEPQINVGGWWFRGTAPVEMRYFACTDGGGSIPQFVQTTATRRTLPDTVVDLVDEVKRRLGR